MNHNKSQKHTLETKVLSINHQSTTIQKPSDNKKNSQSRFSINSHRLKNKRKYNILANTSYLAYLTELRKQVQASSFILKGSTIKGKGEYSSKSVILSSDHRRGLSDVGNAGQTTSLSQYLAPNYVEHCSSRDKSYKRDRIISTRSNQPTNVFKQSDDQQAVEGDRPLTNPKYPLHQSRKTNNSYKTQNYSSRDTNKTLEIKDSTNMITSPFESTMLYGTSSNFFPNKDVFHQMSKNCISLKDYAPNKRLKTVASNQNNAKIEENKLINSQSKDNWSVFYAKKHPFQSMLHLPRRKTYISYSNSQMKPL